MTELQCPVPTCSYNTNMDQYRKDIQRPLCLESTRSHRGEDSWRDMDGFDENEELTRLRRALHEVKTLGPKGWDRHKPWILEFGMVRSEPPLIELEAVDRYVSLLLFIAEATSNLDETLTRLGPLPTAWASSRTATPEPQVDMCFNKDEAATDPSLKVNLDITLGTDPMVHTLIVEDGGQIYYAVDIIFNAHGTQDFKAYVQRRAHESDTAGHAMGPLRVYNKEDLTLSDILENEAIDLRSVPFMKSIAQDIVDNYNADRFNDKPKIQV